MKAGASGVRMHANKLLQRLSVSSLRDLGRGLGEAKAKKFPLKPSSFRPAGGQVL